MEPTAQNPIVRYIDGDILHIKIYTTDENIKYLLNSSDHTQQVDALMKRLLSKLLRMFQGTISVILKSSNSDMTILESETEREKRDAEI